MEFLTTEQVAERLGVTPRRVQAMAKAGRLPAMRFGRALMIKEEDIALVAYRKPGRPPMTDEEKAQRAAEREAGLPLEPPATKAKARVKKTGVKKTAKKGA